MESFISQKEHQLLLDAIKEHAIFMIDTEGRISSWNEGARRLKGFEEEEVIGRHLRMLFLPEDRDGRPEEEMQEALETGKFEEEWWRLRKDGSRFWAHIILQPVFDDAGTHIGFAKITTDRTAQRRVDELNTFLMNEVMGYAVFLLDASGNIAKWSRAAQDIFGYAEPEVLGKPLALLYAGDEVAGRERQAAAHLEAALADRFEDEEWKRRKDGNIFWASCVLAPLHNKDGFVVLLRDLSEKRLFEQESKANIALTASNKELERFAYVVSHDLKEPVRKISTFSHMLQGESPKQVELIEKIVNSSRRMAQLIDDILEFSSAARNQPFLRQDLTKILEAALESLDELVREKGATIEYDPLPAAAVIPSQMEQLFQNLVSNAVKFCCLGDETPKVRIRSRIVNKEDLPREFLQQVLQSEQYLQISVADNGIGFKPEHASGIFDLFRRLHGKAEFEGTGVGLSICKKVAENHGGHISATSEKGKGALFLLTLPHDANLRS